MLLTQTGPIAPPALHALAAMAERTGACVLLVRHLNKVQGGPAVYRGGGSIGIVGAARVGLLVGKHPQGNDTRVLGVVKCNLALEAPGSDTAPSKTTHWAARASNGLASATCRRTPS